MGYFSCLPLTFAIDPSSTASRSLLTFLLATFSALQAQTTRVSALSEAEVEEIRDARIIPSDCVLLFVKFLDARTKKIQDLYAKPRQPGREEDTHDLLVQFTSIADELADNLDDYGPRHADLRKALPKVLEAADRWATALKSPPEHETYSVASQDRPRIRPRPPRVFHRTRRRTSHLVQGPSPTKTKEEKAPPIDIPR